MSDVSPEDDNNSKEWQFTLDEVDEDGQVYPEPEPIEAGSPTTEGVLFVLVGVALTLFVLVGV